VGEGEEGVKIEWCSVENFVNCHFEGAESEPRNLFFNRFLDFGPKGLRSE
jgi:hypothetical protein